MGPHFLNQRHRLMLGVIILVFCIATAHAFAVHRAAKETLLAVRPKRISEGLRTLGNKEIAARLAEESDDSGTAEDTNGPESSLLESSMNERASEDEGSTSVPTSTDIEYELEEEEEDDDESNSSTTSASDSSTAIASTTSGSVGSVGTDENVELSEADAKVKRNYLKNLKKRLLSSHRNAEDIKKNDPSPHALVQNDVKPPVGKRKLSTTDRGSTVSTTRKPKRVEKAIVKLGKRRRNNKNGVKGHNYIKTTARSRLQTGLEQRDVDKLKEDGKKKKDPRKENLQRKSCKGECSTQDTVTPYPRVRMKDLEPKSNKVQQLLQITGGIAESTPVVPHGNVRLKIDYKKRLHNEDQMSTLPFNTDLPGFYNTKSKGNQVFSNKRGYSNPTKDRKIALDAYTDDSRSITEDMYRGFHGMQELGNTENNLIMDMIRKEETVTNPSGMDNLKTTEDSMPIVKRFQIIRSEYKSSPDVSLEKGKSHDFSMPNIFQLVDYVKKHGNIDEDDEADKILKKGKQEIDQDDKADKILKKGKQEARDIPSKVGKLTHLISDGNNITNKSSVENQVFSPLQTSTQKYEESTFEKTSLPMEVQDSTFLDSTKVTLTSDTAVTQPSTVSLRHADDFGEKNVKKRYDTIEAAIDIRPSMKKSFITPEEASRPALCDRVSKLGLPDEDTLVNGRRTWYNSDGSSRDGKNKNEVKVAIRVKQNASESNRNKQITTFPNSNSIEDLSLSSEPRLITAIEDSSDRTSTSSELGSDQEQATNSLMEMIDAIKPMQQRDSTFTPPNILMEFKAKKVLMEFARSKDKEFIPVKQVIQFEPGNKGLYVTLKDTTEMK